MMGSPIIHEIDIQPLEHFQIREVVRCILHTIMFNRALGLVRPKAVESQLFDSISYVQCGDPEAEQRIDERIEHLCRLVEKSPTFCKPLSASVTAGPSSSLSVSTSSSSSASEKSLTRAQITLSFFERVPLRKTTSSSGIGNMTSWFGVGSSTSISSSSSSGRGHATGAPQGSGSKGSSSGGLANSGSTKGGCWEQWVVNLSVVPQKQEGGSQEREQQQQGVRKSTSRHGSEGTVVQSAFESAERITRSNRLESELGDVLLSVLLMANQNRERIPPVLTSDIIPFPYEINTPSLSESSFGMDLLKRMLQATPPPLLA